MKNCRFLSNLLYGSQKLFIEQYNCWRQKERGENLKAFHFKNICELLCNGNLQNATLNYAMTKTIYIQNKILIMNECFDVVPNIVVM